MADAFEIQCLPPGPSEMYSQPASLASLPTFRDLIEPTAEVMRIIGVKCDDVNDLDAVVPATQHLTGGDYSKPNNPLHLSAGQQAELTELYPCFKITDEWRLEGEGIDKVVVLGTLALGNEVRLDFTRDAVVRGGGLTLEQLILAGGERYIFPEQELGDMHATIGRIRASFADAISQGSRLSDEYIQVERWLARIERQATAHVDETDLFRLAALDRLGPLALRAIHLQLGPIPSGKKLLRYYDYDWMGTRVSLLHTRATKRNGDDRHDTPSCLRDCEETFGFAQGSRVVIVGNQPHLPRLALTARRVFEEMGRPDLEVFMAGPAAPARYGHDVYLQEIAQYLYELKLLSDKARGVRPGRIGVMR